MRRTLRLVYAWGTWDVQDDNQQCIHSYETFEEGLQKLQAYSCEPIVVATTVEVMS